MVQFIERGPSFGEQVGQSVGGALSKFSDMMTQLGLEKLKQQQLKDLITPKRQKSEGKMFSPESKKSLWSALSPEQQTQLDITQPQLAKNFREDDKQAYKEKQFGHSSTEKYAEETRTSSQQAEEAKYATNLMRQAIRSGKTGPTAQNLAYSYLKDIKSPLAGAFQSKQGGEFNVGMKTLASGFKKLMGAKPTEREFFWYEDILPGLMKQAPTNEAILDYFDHLSDMDIKKQELSDQIVEQNGGYRPIDLDQKVRKAMRPILNEAINEGYKLSGEFEEPKKGENKKTIFTDKPSAASSNQGKILTDHESGEQWISNGKEWISLNG